jgi:hypothetical protein
MGGIVSEGSTTYPSINGTVGMFEEVVDTTVVHTVVVVVLFNVEITVLVAVVVVVLSTALASGLLVVEYDVAVDDDVVVSCISLSFSGDFRAGIS